MGKARTASGRHVQVWETDAEDDWVRKEDQVHDSRHRVVVDLSLWRLSVVFGKDGCPRRASSVYRAESLGGGTGRARELAFSIFEGGSWHSMPVEIACVCITTKTMVLSHTYTR